MPQTINTAVQTAALGKRYRSFWALRDCTITVPQGSVTALVGPNGAGKTTLLKLLAGLARANAGSVTIFDQTAGRSGGHIADIGYLAQETPLYRGLTAAEHITVGQHLNQRWDSRLAQDRLRELKIPLDRPVGVLSGGQRSQVGLALALAKQPRLLLLDEPVAALDPLARVEFLTSLTQAVAEANGKLTVIMSSHLLVDLERVCDHLVILAAGETQLCDSLEDTLRTHALLVGPRNAPIPTGITVIKETHAPNTTNLFVRLGETTLHDPHWQVHPADIEDIVLAYMGQTHPQQTLITGETR